jgi:hypothetical protein
LQRQRINVRASAAPASGNSDAHEARAQARKFAFIVRRTNRFLTLADAKGIV